MAVITISRQFGSGGDEIADRICELLGYHHFDKSLIEQAAAEAGLSESEAIDYSEDNHHVKTFLDRLLGRATDSFQMMAIMEGNPGVVITDKTPISEDAVMALVQQAIHSAYKAGNIVIVGRGGQVTLKDSPGVLHVRIEAPLEDRIQRVKSVLKEERGDYKADIEIRRTAQDQINNRDLASADYIKRFYAEDWSDPLLYHVVLNTGKLTIEQAAEVVVDLVHRIVPVAA